MKTIQNAVCVDLDIKKSRFLGCVEPIANMADGMARVMELRQQHPDATHVCFSMLVHGQVRQSDDGEPSGTAAAPMLNVLQHKGLDHVLATVVRYFGGVKLGAGGLVRAYSQAVSEAVQLAQIVEIKPSAKAVLQSDFEYESTIRRMAESANIRVAVEYSANILVALEGETVALENLCSELSELTRGRVIRIK